MTTPRSTAVPLAVAALVAALLATGCGASDESDEEDAKPAGATLPARERPTGDEWAQGPARPKEGEPYAYDMLAHCEIAYARFGGRWWKLESVSVTSRSHVRGKAAGPGNIVPGYMSLIGPDAAVFEAAGLPPMHFAPHRGKPPACR
ncbi:hypothetical protein ACIG3E_28505 [Streptomyces sp. NPDC053474]|uniref:hypothetical protein n=1 Tax=Streptomyces sp. NPDC053474 TaxID=3365704 RepID=UPI0037D18248